MAESCSCPNVLWKVELSSNEIVFLGEPISKQSLEGAASFLITAYSEICKEINHLKTELFIKKEAELKDLEYSWLINIANDEKV